MKLWIDSQLSPSLAPWINESIPEIEAVSLKWLGMRDSGDLEVFLAARENDAVVMTKDTDFADLLMRYGPPPKVIWLTCGNTSNGVIKEILRSRLTQALQLLTDQDPLVEIR